MTTVIWLLDTVCIIYPVSKPRHAPLLHNMIHQLVTTLTQLSDKSFSCQKGYPIPSRTSRIIRCLTAKWSRDCLSMASCWMSLQTRMTWSSLKFVEFFLHFEKSDIEDLPLCNFETTHRGSGIAIYVSHIHSRIMHVVPTKITWQEDSNHIKFS